MHLTHKNTKYTKTKYCMIICYTYNILNQTNKTNIIEINKIKQSLKFSLESIGRLKPRPFSL